MHSTRSTEALQFIRKLRGGSQPILASGSDGFQYVVKFFDNLQGPNVAFNDAVGTELYRLLGFPVPEWRVIYVSDEFIDQNPGCWIEMPNGMRKPRGGWCFGSRYIGLSHSRLFEIIPRRYFDQIENRRDFWLAWVVDVLCGHSDNRQVICLERAAGCLEALFIDHGHLLSGADGAASPVIWAPRYLDLEIYPSVSVEDADRIYRILEHLSLTAIEEVVYALPQEWRTPSALSGLDLFIARKSNLAGLNNVIRALFGLWECEKTERERRFTQNATRFGRTKLPSQVPEPEIEQSNCGAGDLTRGKRWRGPEDFFALCSQTAHCGH
jgi:hypothetical protein